MRPSIMFSYPGVHGMLMVHVGANIRDDMNLRAPMFPWAFEKEQRKGRRQSKKGGGGRSMGNAHGSGQRFLLWATEFVIFT